MTSSDHEVTELLQQWSKGDPSAFDRLMPLVYRELHKIAKRHMRTQNGDHTLQTTAVIHEAYLKLAGTDQDLRGREHFFAVAATAIRHILVDHARSRKAAKRGGPLERLNLDAVPDISSRRDRELIALDEALESLAKVDPRRAKVVELRFFAGLGVEEASRVLNVSEATVLRDWRLARAWLLTEL